MALTWLFGGLRSDEIARLRVGCIRWQREDVALPGDTDETLDKDAVCLLDVPVHKTGTAFTKPVDPIAGPGHRSLGGRPADPARRPGPQDRRTGAPAVLLPSARNRQAIPEHPRSSRALRQGRRPDRRRPRQHHQPPGSLHHRQPALQRQGAHDAVRAAGLARPPKSSERPSITPRSPRTRWPRPTATPATSPATSAPSKSSSTATPSPPALRRLASLGSTTTSATATAPTASSSNVHTEWPAPAATSTPRRTPARRNCWRPRKTSSACWPASRSPTTNKRQSTTGRPPSTGYLERLIDVPTPDGATPREIGVPATATLLPIIAVNQGK